MAAKLMSKKSFLRSGEGSISSYNYTDIISGVAYKTFYAIDMIEGTNTIIKTFVEDTDVGAHTGFTTSNGNAAQDVDFDLPIKKPLTISKGKVFVFIPLGFNVGSPADVTSSVAAKLYYVRNSVETQIGSTASKDVTISTITSIKYGQFGARIDVANPLRLLAGDTLRLTITLSAPGADKGTNFYHDPSEFSKGTLNFSTLATMRLTLTIPFKADI